MASVQTEWDKLRKAGAWDESKVREYHHVAQQHRNDGTPVHFGRVFPLCHEKDSELDSPEEEKLYKRRVVFQGNEVRDEYHEHAMCGELSSSPETPPLRAAGKPPRPRASKLEGNPARLALVALLCAAGAHVEEGVLGRAAGVGAVDTVRVLLRPGASVGYVQATRTSLPRWVRTGGAGRLAPRAPRTVRTGYAYQPRAYRTYRAPWHRRCAGRTLGAPNPTACLSPR